MCLLSCICFRYACFMPAFFRKAGRAVSIAKWHRTPERISLYITLPVSCAETVLQPDQRFLDDIVFTQTALSEKAGNRRDIPRMGAWPAISLRSLHRNSTDCFPASNRDFSGKTRFMQEHTARSGNNRSFSDSERLIFAFRKMKI